MGRISQKQRILAAATKLLGEGKRATLEQIAAATKMSKGGIMYHYPSRAAIMRAVFAYALTSGDKRMINDHLKPVKMLGEMATAYARYRMEPDDEDGS